MAQVLSQLPKSIDPNLLVGAETLDDAGVYRLDEKSALVQTVDFFPPLVDDAYAFGRIAAANALSDIYAMGGRPLTALNIVGFPDDELPAEILSDILRGGSERVQAAGAVIVGGHSVRDSEIKYGLSVTGLVDPNRILTNAGAKPGDVLVLTKPIGSGVLTTAAKSGKIGEDELQECVEVMIQLNDAASRAAVQAGAHAATDVTGFGLIGHAFEMADASSVTIELDARSVPLMSRAYELAKKKCLTRAYKSNLEYVGDRLHAEGIDETLLHVLSDAQTSGGLLIALTEEKAQALLTRPTVTGHASRIIGRVKPADAAAILLQS